MTSPPTGGIEVPVVKFVLFFFGKDKTIFDSRLDREPIKAYNLCLFFFDAKSEWVFDKYYVTDSRLVLGSQANLCALLWHISNRSSHMSMLLADPS